VEEREEGRAIMTDFEDERNYISYGGDGECGQVVFIRRCPECLRFVKADKSVKVNDINGLKDEPNATCSKHGRVKMMFQGFF
jgi:hypothetical protein